MPRWGRMPVPASRFERKLCPICNVEKPLDEFYRCGSNESRDSRLRQSGYCKKCSSDKARAHVLTPRGKAIRQRYRHKRTVERYGLTPETYNELLLAQGSACAICGTKEPGGNGNKFVIDHCHKTGKTRGLLCTKCNSGLGMFEDDVGAMAVAIAYLHDHRGEQS